MAILSHFAFHRCRATTQMLRSRLWCAVWFENQLRLSTGCHLSTVADLGSNAWRSKKNFTLSQDLY